LTPYLSSLNKFIALSSPSLAPATSNGMVAQPGRTCLLNRQNWSGETDNRTPSGRVFRHQSLTAGHFRPYKEFVCWQAASFVQNAVQIS
jgi:hypothetical protein